MQAPLAWPSGSSRATLEIVESPVVSEVRQAFVGWGTLTTRLWRGARAAELEWTVGPVPVADGVGKEVALRLRTDLDTGPHSHSGSPQHIPFTVGAAAAPSTAGARHTPGHHNRLSNMTEVVHR